MNNKDNLLEIEIEIEIVVEVEVNITSAVLVPSVTKIDEPDQRVMYRLINACH